MDIKMLEGSNKIELISTNEIKHKQCLPWKKPKHKYVFALEEAKTQIWRKCKCLPWKKPKHKYGVNMDHLPTV